MPAKGIEFGIWNSINHLYFCSTFGWVFSALLKYLSVGGNFGMTNCIKHITFFLATVFYLGDSCTTDTTPMRNLSVSNNLSLDSIENDDVNIDTSEECIFCENVLYKIIDPKTILIIECLVPIQFDSTKTVFLDSSSKMGSLAIFVENDADLRNICTDALDYNHSPQMLITNCEGKISFKFNLEENTNGSKDTLTSVLVHDLCFNDSISKRTYALKNEVLWRVRKSNFIGG